MTWQFPISLFLDRWAPLRCKIHVYQRDWKGQRGRNMQTLARFSNKSNKHQNLKGSLYVIEFLDPLCYLCAYATEAYIHIFIRTT